MIIDESLMFWDNQTLVSATVGSNSFYSNIIDMEGTANATLATGAYGHGAGGNIYFTVMLPTSVVGGTSVEFQLVTSDATTGAVATSNLALSSPTVILDTTAILTSNVPANFVASGVIPLNGVKQYLQVNYIPVGLFTSGAVNAFLSESPPATNNIPLYPSTVGAV